MLDGSSSGCINHPGVDASARCKQCNKPVCGACTIKAPTGNFCSMECKDKYETFVQRAAQVESMRKPGKLGKMLKGLIGKLIVIAILLLGLGILGALVDIPVLSGLVDKVRGALSI